MNPIDHIARKRDGFTHSERDLRELVTAVVDGSMPDYQAAAWLMAAFLNGLDDAETLALTLAMRDSGRKIDLASIPGVKLDKHSSGGVGDKTTLVVVPLLAAGGVPVLKMSGRGLGFSGGTIDKLDSIPGFRSDLSLDRAVRQVTDVGAALLGQSPDLVPADKKLYALRDVTATIESIPLIAASIMSKKLAGGADCVLLDVKVGSGAFMKSVERARELASAMVRIGDGAGVKTVAALTAMDEPLGYAVGNALEVREACDLLTGGPNDGRFRELCIVLAARGFALAGMAEDDAGGRGLAESLLASGRAAAKFEGIIAAQGGDFGIVRNPDKLPVAKVICSVRAASDGFVRRIDGEAIGRLAVTLGAGRAKKEDTIDHAVGIILKKKTGDRLGIGDVLAEVHMKDDTLEQEAIHRVRGAYDVRDGESSEGPILYEFIGA